MTEPGTAETRVPQWRGVSHAVAFVLANMFVFIAASYTPIG
jgi:hypothetical protein